MLMARASPEERSTTMMEARMETAARAAMVAIHAPRRMTTDGRPWVEEAFCGFDRVVKALSPVASSAAILSPGAYGGESACAGVGEKMGVVAVPSKRPGA